MFNESSRSIYHNEQMKFNNHRIIKYAQKNQIGQNIKGISNESQNMIYHDK